MEKKKSCRDCRFFWNDSAMRCGHEKSEGQNNIGDPTWLYASQMRDDPNKCGWDAKLFAERLPMTWGQIAERTWPLAAIAAVLTTCCFIGHP